MSYWTAMLCKESGLPRLLRYYPHINLFYVQRLDKTPPKKVLILEVAPTSVPNVKRVLRFYHIKCTLLRQSACPAHYPYPMSPTSKKCAPYIQTLYSKIAAPHSAHRVKDIS